MNIRHLLRAFPNEATMDFGSALQAIAQVLVALIQRGSDEEKRELELEGLRLDNERKLVEIEILREHGTLPDDDDDGCETCGTDECTCLDTDCEHLTDSTDA